MGIWREKEMKKKQVFNVRECSNCCEMIIAKNNVDVCMKFAVELVTDNMREKRECEMVDRKMFAQKCLNCDVMIITKSNRKICKKCRIIFYELISQL